MKTRELTMEEKLDILKLRKEGKSIRAVSQALGIANTTVWNVLKKQETTGVLTTRHRTGRPRKTTAVDDRMIVRAVKKNPQITVGNITNNLHLAGVNISQATVRRRLREQRYRFNYINCEPVVSGKEEEEDRMEPADDAAVRDEDLKEEQFDEYWQQTECCSDVSPDSRRGKTGRKAAAKEAEDGGV